MTNVGPKAPTTNASEVVKPSSKGLGRVQRSMARSVVQNACPTRSQNMTYGRINSTHKRLLHFSAIYAKHTGGEGSITQWVHGEFIVISETICSHFTHQAHSEHF